MSRIRVGEMIMGKAQNTLRDFPHASGRMRVSVYVCMCVYVYACLMG